MAITCVLLAITSRGVSAGSETLVNASDQDYEAARRRLEVQHPQALIVPFLEREIEEYLKKIQQKRMGQ